MTDLKSLSNDDLMALISAPQATPQDIRRLSDDELMARLKGEAPKPTPPEEPGQWERFKRGLAAIAEDPSLLLEVGPGRVVKSIQSAVTLPGDVLAGRESIPFPSEMTPEQAHRVADLAMLASPAAPARLTTQGAQGIPRAQQRSQLFDPTAGGPKPAPAAVPSPGAEIAAAAERAGIDIPRAALMPPVVQKVAAGVSDLPIVGKPLQDAAERAVTQAAERVGELASTVGTASREGAGQGIQEGVRAFKTEGIPAIEAEVFRPINAAIPKDAKFEAATTAQALAEIRGRLGQSSGSLAGEAARIQRAMEEKGGRLTFQALQDLRSSLGAEMRDALNRQGYDDFVPSRLYATLSNDLRDAAASVGGKDLAGAWDAANATTRDAWRQFKELQPLGRESGAPNSVFEQFYSLAMDRRGNAGKLAQIRKTIGKENWNDAVSTVVDRMGRNSNEGFSMQFFVNAYEKMSPQAKSILFDTPELKGAISDLATSFKALQGIERFKSRSHSANPMATAGMAGGAAGGALVEPFSAALAGIGAYAGARFLASPASARSLANWTKAYTAYVKKPSAGLANRLSQRATTAGAIVAEQSGVPQFAGQIAAQLQAVVKAVNDNLSGGMRSGRAAEQDESQDR